MTKTMAVWNQTPSGRAATWGDVLGQLAKHIEQQEALGTTVTAMSVQIRNKSELGLSFDYTIEWREHGE